jgi:hypothetical protein
MLKRISSLSAVVLLAACSNMTQYERQVADWEPVYCYKSIGAVQCYKEPKHSDSRRLVNFYGPAPSEYDEPDEPTRSHTRPPKTIKVWVKDAEPVPQASPARVHVATPQPAGSETKALGAEQQGEDVSLMDGLMRSLFGKPELASKPVAQAPAPAAQPVGKVETGTL